MGRQDVKLREYKVMLDPTRFAGPDDAVRVLIAGFWSDLGVVLSDKETNVDGSFDLIKHRRRVRFYDTDNQLLHEHSYVFRERVDVDTGEREMTLKFRHPDRYVAADRKMSTSGREAETKFEEDVKPPFVSVFSFSTTAPVDAEEAFDTIRQIGDLYPGLAAAFEDLPGDRPLSLVGDFSARETVFVGASVLLGRPQVPAPCAMVIWHDDDDPATPPVAVEFSYKYGDEDEDYSGSLARDAHDFLQLLFTQVPAWVSAKAMTKTGLVYRTSGPAAKGEPGEQKPEPKAAKPRAAKPKAAKKATKKAATKGKAAKKAGKGAKARQ